MRSTSRIFIKLRLHASLIKTRRHQAYLNIFVRSAGSRKSHPDTHIFALRISTSVNSVFGIMSDHFGDAPTQWFHQGARGSAVLRLRVERPGKSPARRLRGRAGADTA